MLKLKEEINEKAIESLAQRIALNFRPEKILLFGSYAKGTNFPDSDVDLFIVMNSSLRRDDRSREVSKLFPDRLFALDVVVFTPEEVAQSVQSKNSFITTILKEGKVLYEN